MKPHPPSKVRTYRPRRMVSKVGIKHGAIRDFIGIMNAFAKVPKGDYWRKRI